MIFFVLLHAEDLGDLRKVLPGRCYIYSIDCIRIFEGSGDLGLLIAMADQKDSAPAAEAEMKTEEPKSEVKPAAEAAKPAAEAPAAKKLWSDEDFGEADFSGLKVADPEDIVDKPERLKSETIVEPETIKKVREGFH